MDKMKRKEFLKKIGITTASTAVLSSCNLVQDKTNDTQVLSELDVPKNKMTYRTNPNGGDRISLLGYGCMRLPMKEKQNKEEPNTIDQENWNSLVDYAIAHGVNYFDTSPAYGGGKSETVTGISLSRHERKKFFVATKMSNFRPESQTREGSIEIYHNSLKNLQVDYLDYYLLHGVGLGGMKDFNTRFIDNGILDFLLKERETGRIRNLGWSFHGDVKVFDHLLAMGIKWDFAQIQLNYVDWENTSGWNVKAQYLYNELEKQNIPAVIMEPLRGGRLAKLDYYSTELLKKREPQKSIASWAFRFAGTPSNVLTVLSGMTFKEHLQDDIIVYSPLKPVDAEDIKVLKEVTQMVLQFPFINCNDCKYCLPCPYGIDIPGIFTHYNNCIGEGNFPKDMQDENYYKARKAFLIGYDRSVPKLRQADHCIGCEKCNSKCPQRLNIHEEMIKIDKYVEQLREGKLITQES